MIAHERTRWWRLAWLLAASSHPVLAGGGPQSVAVVVNDNSADSLALGRYYCEQRGIPDSQVVHVSTATSGVMAATAFTNEIFQPLVDALAVQAVSDQVDTVVYCLAFPHAVESGGRRNSLTATTYYGFKTYPGSPVCTLPAATTNAYYDTEESFDQRDRSGQGIRFLSSLLTGYSLEEAKEVVDRSVAADGSVPPGVIHYLHTTDTARNVQWPQFEEADFLHRLLNLPVTGSIQDADFISGESNVVGYVVGRAVVQQLFTNTYQPGAIGDHLTSFGGVLTGTGQMEILDWLKAGCVGSYGTVVEPCNFTNKFPGARLHYYYGRGFSMGEAYAMAVANPYMGLVVGDPLCAPYAVAPVVQIGGLTTGEVVSGTVPLTVTGASSNAVQQLDLYVDDRLVAAVTNVVTTVGDGVSITVDGDTRPAPVLIGASGPEIVSSLALAVNRPPPLPVSARAKSDRLELVHDVPGTSGADIAYSVSVTGTNLVAVASGTHLLDPVYPARQVLTLSGTPRAGDSLSLVVTPLAGSPVTNEVFQQSGDEVDDLLARLRDAVNQDTNLQSSAGCEMKYLTASGGEVEAYVVARTNHWSSYNIQVEYEVHSVPVIGMEGPDYQGPLASNEDVLAARGAVFVSVGRTNLAGSVDLDTTLLADGPHTLRAVAVEGSAVRTQGAFLLPFEVRNHAFRCSLRTPAAGNAFLVAQDVLLEAEVTGGTATCVHFLVEGKLDATLSGAPFTHAFSTTHYGVGTMGVQALAHSDAGEAVLSERIAIHLLDPSDGDGDGLPDGWELFHFGGTNVTDGTVDADGDQQSDAVEFVADTDPNHAGSRFELIDVRVSPSEVAVEFVSSPARRFTVEANHGALTNEGAWVGLAPTNRPGDPGWTSLVDTNAPATGPVSYRVRVTAP